MNKEKNKEGLNVLYQGRHLGDNSYYDFLREESPSFNKFFLKIQKELSLIEDDLQHARRYYNGVVRKFNSFINLFPVCLLKKLFTLTDKPFFQLDGEHEKLVPNVKDFL